MIINLPKLGPVRFRDDLTPEQFRAQLEELQQKYDFKLPKPEVGIGTLLKRGFMRGLGETGIALGDVLPAMGASALGFEDYARRQMGEAATSRAELEQKYPTQFKSYTEVSSPYEALQYGAETLGELGPSALTAMVPGVGAGMVGGRLAGQAAMRSALAAGPLPRAGLAAAETAAKTAAETVGRRAMYGGVFFGSFAQNAPEVFENIYRETDKLEPGLAALMGGLGSVLDSIVPGGVLDKLGSYGKLKVIEKMAKDSGAAPKVWKAIGAEAAKAAGTEGLTESAQQFLSASAAQIAGSAKGVLDPENIQQYKEAFVKGAVGGLGFGTVSGTSRALTERREYRNTQEAEKALQEQMEQERLAGTLTPEKQAEYDIALENARKQREAELTKAFATMPEDVGAVSIAALRERAEAIKADNPGAYERIYGELDKAAAASKAKDANAEAKAKAKAEKELAKAEAEYAAGLRNKQAGTAFARAEPTPGTGGMFRPGLEQQRMQQQMGLRDFAFGSLGPPPPNDPVTYETLNTLKVPERSKVGQKLLGVDLATPEGQRTFIQALEDPAYTGNIDGAAYDEFIASFDPQVVATAREEMKVEPVSPTKQRQQEQTRAFAFGAPDVTGTLKPAARTSPSVPSESTTGAATEVAEQSEPSGMVSTGPTPSQLAGGEGQQPAAIVEEEVAPPAPAPAPAAGEVTTAGQHTPESDALFNAIKTLEEEQRSLLTRAGRIPAVNSKARKRWDELDEQIGDMKDQWGQMTSRLALPPAPSTTALVAAPTPAPAPAAPAPAAPAPAPRLALAAPPTAPAPSTPRKVGFTVEEQKPINQALAKLDDIEVDPETTKGRAVAFARTLHKKGLIDDFSMNAVESMSKDKDMGAQDVVDELKLALQDAKEKLGKPEPLTIEGETRVISEGETQLINAGLAQLPAPSVTKLEQHYESKRDSEEFLAKLREDVYKYVTKGAEAVAKSIRDIIKKVSEGVLAVGIIFNPGLTASHFQFNLPATIKAAQEVRAEVPADAKRVMSTEAQKVYEAMAPAAKESGKGFIIGDKPNGKMHAFKADGTLIVSANALTGKDTGDVLGKSSLEGGPKVTPAGKFTLQVSQTEGYGTTFDLVETYDGTGWISIHSAYLGNPAEKRAERLAAGKPEESRITYGCWNLDNTVIKNKLAPNIADLNGGMMFVIPDNDPALARMLTTPGTVSVEVQVPVASGEAGARAVVGREEKAPSSEIDRIANTDFNKLFADKDLAALHVPARAEVLGHLERGNLVGALQSMAAKPSSETARRIATALARVVGNVKVVYGAERSMYDPNTNTIYLRDGASAYEVLHESTHAALSHILDNPSHPVTREITNLFNQLKGNIEGAYGAQDVQEFTAEAWSNEEFRTRLKEFRPDGQKLTGWQRLVNAVRRMLGFAPKTETALDKLDRMIDDIISPPPDTRTGDTLYAQSLNNPSIAQKIFAAADSGLAKVPHLTTERRTAVWAALEKMTMPMRSLFYKTLNLSAIGQIGTKYFGDKSLRFSDLVNGMAGYQEKLLEAMQPLHQRLTDFRNSGGERYVEFSRLINDSTIPDIRPYPDPKTEAMYKGTGKYAEYVALRDRFKKLKPEEQQLYRDYFATFKALDKEFEKSLKGNLEGVVDDKEKALSAYDKIMQELAALRIDHYAPLYREPSLYWLTYDLNGKPVKRMLETQAERAAARKKAEAQGATNIEEFSRVEQIDFKNVPDGTMLSSIMKIMKDAGAGEDDLNKLIQLVVKALPETSILKSRQRRTGVAGYLDDNAAYVFDRVTSNSARQIARMRYGQQMKKLLAEMREAQAKLRGEASADAKMMLEDLDGRYEFVMNPNVSNFAQYASTGAFYWNLAANVSSALVNVLQTPMVVFPQLGGRYGWKEATAALNNARKLYTGSGFSRNVQELDGRSTTQRAMLSVENRLGSAEGKPYTALIEALRSHGLLQTSTARDALQSENQNSSGFGGTNKLQRVTTLVGTFMFHHAERFNREVTAVATYDLEMARLKRDKPKMSDADRQEAAIREAIRMVEYTHGAGSTLAGPSLGQSDIGKVLMVFKRFAFSMYYMLFDTMRRSLPIPPNATEEQKDAVRAARRQLVGIYGMAALFAGAKGIPMYWVAEMAYNMFQDDDEDKFDDVMRKFLGDFLYKGPVNYFTNLSIADRVGWTDLIFRENKGDRADASAVTQTLEGLLGAPYSILLNLEKGYDQIADGHLYRGIETMLPAGIKNILKGGRYALEGANTLRGDPVMGDINGYNSMMQILGFAPADLMTQYEENAYMTGRQKTIRDREKRLLKQYYIALREGDYDRMVDVRDDLFTLGAKYPELGISGDKLNKSVATRDRISQKMYHGVQIDDKLRARLQGAADTIYD